jgi:hypothetical protein
VIVVPGFWRLDHPPSSLMTVVARLVIALGLPDWFVIA